MKWIHNATKIAVTGLVLLLHGGAYAQSGTGAITGGTEIPADVPRGQSGSASDPKPSDEASPADEKGPSAAGDAPRSDTSKDWQEGSSTERNSGGADDER